MILLDTNLLLCATIDSSEHHEQIRRWMSEQFASARRIGLPWPSLLGFVRIASNRRAYPSGPSAGEAWHAVRQWLALDNVWIPQPTDRHADVLDQLFSSTRVRSDDVMDVHLAALAIEHGLTLCSADRDFARYSKLRWFNPLET